MTDSVLHLGLTPRNRLQRAVRGHSAAMALVFFHWRTPLIDP